MTNMKKYSICRPPLAKTFDLPSREDLLKVKKGKHVKLIFTDPYGTERMWVKVMENKEVDEWKGVLDNQPFTMHMKLGQKVVFHPLDVIDIS